MKWKVIPMPTLEFNEKTAIEGDMYWMHNGRLVFVSNAIDNPRKHSLIERIKMLLWRKKTGGVVILNQRTLEYIYNVCKGVMPETKEQFVECVMRTIPDDLTNR